LYTAIVSLTCIGVAPLPPGGVLRRGAAGQEQGLCGGGARRPYPQLRFLLRQVRFIFFKILITFSFVLFYKKCRDKKIIISFRKSIYSYV